MNHKEFLRQVELLKSYQREGKSLRTRYQMWKIKRTIRKLILRSAKSQSRLIFNQTVKLYTDILESNLTK